MADYKRLWVKTRALGRLVRVMNLGMLFLCQLLVALCLVEPCSYAFSRLIDGQLWILMFATAFSAAGGYVINDYYDVKIDSINKPRRVTIDRQFTRGQAILMHQGFSVLAIAIALLCTYRVATLVAVSSALLWLYSNHLKRLPLVGNLVIGLLVAIAILMPQLWLERTTPLGLTVAGLAMVLTWIRELVKDMEDHKGDRTFGCQTLPIVAGIRTSKWVVYGFVMLLGILLATSILAGWVTGLMKYHLWLMLPFMAHFLLQLYKADTVKQFDALSMYAKLLMLAGMASLFWAPWC